ncbi:aKG-HExxH-type peptide beta-hydroxylase [Legionella sp. D16C41]|uniref:aKG-HExxH-type peptide beta-hydroxylase n=1 Tax=Legionella sp. D16C41 TaxID=3402688 RepID=UPI003AF5ED1B
MTVSQKLLYLLPMQPFMGKKPVKAMHFSLRKRTKVSFLELIQAAEKGLKINFNLSEKFTKLDNKKIFSSLLYFYYYSLLEAMQEQNKDQVFKLCRLLMKIDINNFYTTPLLIGCNSLNPIIKFQKNYIKATAQRIETFKPLSPIEYDLARKYIDKVLIIIKKVNRNLYDEMHEILLLLHLSKGTFFATAATSLRYFGMIIMRYKVFESAEQQFLYFFDSLVHETSHVFLNLLMTLDPIILNSTDLYHSPARNVLRPLKGIFHAHFVFFRLIIMYKLAASYLIGAENHVKSRNFNIAIRDLPYNYQERLAAYQVKFKQGEEILLKHAKLTDFGVEFLRSLNLESQDALPQIIST